MDNVISFLETENQAQKEVSYYYGINQSIAALSAIRIGGIADLIISPTSEAALVRLLQFISKLRVRYRIVGNFSNLLFSDKGFRGALIRTELLASLSGDGTTVLASAGVSLSRLCKYARAHSITGFEELFGIPGSVGGAVYMNAGAFETKVSDLLESACILDTNTFSKRTLTPRELSFATRDSLLQHRSDLILLSAKFVGKEGRSDLIEQKMRDVILRRRKTQPLELPSLGSIFRRPVGSYAGRLIEEAGLKGARVGGAAISQKHAGFIVNLENATAADVLELIRLTRVRVKEVFGIDLVCEIEYISEA
ncbi:MAG: UDP-N-acetylmuramate dehydrogenase [Clostridia bacterium]|nr:UDP-N-acetylmuramate dehydrogenase [Clostridia bacterium]